MDWFALHVRRNHERLVATALGHKRYEALAPTYKAVRCWSDRIKRLDLPLFPGYVFCALDSDRTLPILNIPGVIGIVGFGSGPAVVDPDEMEAIRTIVAAQAGAEPWAFLTAGQQVRIAEGPLRGVAGILVQQARDCRVVVSVSLLQRSLAVAVDADWVVPLGPAPVPRPLGMPGICERR